MEECAHSCQRLTYFFIYGTNDLGDNRCGSSGCKCYCELEATPGECSFQVKHKGYLLYKYTDKYKSDITGKNETSRDTIIFLRCWIVIFRTYQYFWSNKPLPLFLEWLHILHLARNMHIRNPFKYCSGLIFTCWDAANLIDWRGIGQHAFCDVDGNSLKLSDMKTGMYIKIRTKTVNFHGYEYLYTADGSYGMYFAMYYIKT